MTKEEEKIINSISSCKYKCKCSHVVVLTSKVNYKVCSYCGNMIFKNKKDEFFYRAKEAIIRNRRSVYE